MQKLPHGLAVRVGDLVDVRRQRWRVVSLEPFDACAVITLAGVGSQNLGSEQRVLHPFDRCQSLRVATGARRVGPRAWRHRALRELAHAGSAIAASQATRARIDLLPHQLEPLLAILRGDASRVLIADEVGLGKTIQAGLIAAELLARGRAARVLVLCPAGVREQWADEFLDRFGLTTTIADAHELRRRQRELPVGVNPWLLEAITIASLDFAKRAEVLAALIACQWDLVIVDEAHHAASASDRQRATARICASAAHVVLLTATPHNGDPHAFTSLCNTGRCGDELMIFRRTRAEAGLTCGRHVHRLHVRSSTAERRLHGLLTQLEREAGRERTAGMESALTLAILRKRALSSAFALERTITHRLVALPDWPANASGQQLPLPLETDLDAADEDQPPGVPLLSDLERERRLLEQIREASRAAQHDESKFLALERLIRRLEEPVIVFTEYRDTLLHLRARVAPGAAIIHGGMTREERRAALARFPSSGVLLATDAAGEGLNLQQACRIVINLELPWNPMRLEQRIGRVDRIGQRRRVHAWHLIAAGTYEERVLERLRRRVAEAARAVGTVSPLGTATAIAPADFPPHPPTTEATTECSRLIALRHTLRDSRFHLNPASATRWTDSTLLVARSRRWNTRVGLRGQSLLICALRLHDGAGHLVASAILPARVRPTTLKAAMAGMWRDERRPPWLLAWIEQSRRWHEAYWARRMERETFHEAPDRRPPFQGGLFDQRSERIRQRQIDLDTSTALDTAGRIAVLTARARLVVGPIEPLLVLET